MSQNTHRKPHPTASLYLQARFSTAIDYVNSRRQINFGLAIHAWLRSSKTHAQTKFM